MNDQQFRAEIQKILVRRMGAAAARSAEQQRFFDAVEEIKRQHAPEDYPPAPVSLEPLQ